jgi:hypothetical protein
MQPIEFSQQTTILAKNQPQYTPLPVHIKYEEREVPHPNFKGVTTKANIPWELTACFELSPEEIGEICRTGKVWYAQCVFGNQFQPIRLSTQNPFEPVKDGTNAFEIPPTVQGWPDELAENIFCMLKSAIGQSQAHAIMLHLATRLKPVTNPQPDLQAFLRDPDFRKIWEQSISEAVLQAYDKWDEATADEPKIWPSNQDLLAIGGQAANTFMDSILGETFTQAEKSPIADLVNALKEDQQYYDVWESHIASNMALAFKKWHGGTLKGLHLSEDNLLDIGKDAAKTFIERLYSASEATMKNQ